MHVSNTVRVCHIALGRAIPGNKWLLVVAASVLSSINVLLHAYTLACTTTTTTSVVVQVQRDDDRARAHARRVTFVVNTIACILDIDRGVGLSGGESSVMCQFARPPGLCFSDFGLCLTRRPGFGNCGEEVANIANGVW